MYSRIASTMVYCMTETNICPPRSEISECSTHKGTVAVMLCQACQDYCLLAGSDARSRLLLRVPKNRSLLPLAHIVTKRFENSFSSVGNHSTDTDCTSITATMSVVSLLGVKVLNNPAPFVAPYEFEITFECLEQLREGSSILV